MVGGNVTDFALAGCLQYNIWWLTCWTTRVCVCSKGRCCPRHELNRKKTPGIVALELLQLPVMHSSGGTGKELVTAACPSALTAPCQIRVCSMAEHGVDTCSA